MMFREMLETFVVSWQIDELFVVVVVGFDLLVVELLRNALCDCDVLILHDVLVQP